MHTVNLPVALDSALQSLSAQYLYRLGTYVAKESLLQSSSDSTLTPPCWVNSHPHVQSAIEKKSPSALKRDHQRATARQQHTRQHGDTVRSSGSDTNDKQETASMADTEPVLFFSPHHQVDTAALHEHNAAKDEDRQVGDYDQSPELCRIDLPEATDPSAVTLPETMEESRDNLEEWENDRQATLTYLESQGDDVFDSVVLSASRTGPVLEKTVLDYRYGHNALLGLTEDFVFVDDLIQGTVSDYFLIMLIVS